MRESVILKTGRWLKGYALRRLAWLSVVVPGACFLLLLPVSFWPWELARHFQIYTLTLLTGLILTSCGLRWWRRALANAAALLLLAVPLWPYYFGATDAPVSTDKSPPVTPPAREAAASTLGAAAGTGQAAAPDSPEFRFLSYNLLMVGRQQEETRQALDVADPDMLLLLEFTPAWNKALQPVLDKYEWKLGLPQRDSFGIWFGSRRRMEQLRLVVVGDGPFPTIVGRARVGGKTVGVVGAHPMNPVFPSWSAIWRGQFEEYPAFLQEMGGDASVFAGDLNCTPFARTFSHFLNRTGLHDAARGRGLMNTWSGPGLPIRLGLPIDHLLVSDRLKVLDLRRGPPLGSDHRWLEARLRVE